MKAINYIAFIFSLLLLQVTLFAQPDCGCTNCPLPIENNATQSGYLSLVVDGPNDLSECPLEQVCFEIEHTWIGDLSVSLTSPDGTAYLVMADVNNDSLGCGNSNNNIDICVTTGISNPNSDNTEYQCDGGPFDCLNGDYTVPCGGVFDPITNVPQAPNCDLNDFNQVGSPANGTWTLTINDICPWDIGVLNNFYLVFECGIGECYSCDADGGGLSTTPIEACMADAELAQPFTPTHPNGVPDPIGYDYTFLISQGDTILAHQTTVDLTSYESGEYNICGFSYHIDGSGLLDGLIGTTIADLDINFAVCHDLSDDCTPIIIYPHWDLTVIDTTICVNTCFLGPDSIDYCVSSTYNFFLQDQYGCDSTVQVNLTVLPLHEGNLTETICAGDCISIDNLDYCTAGNYDIDLIAYNGCDSVLHLEIIELQVTAIIDVPLDLNCNTDMVTLSTNQSIGDTFEWINEDGGVISNNSETNVSEAGCYQLIVSSTSGLNICSDTATVCVDDISVLPFQPIIQGSFDVCLGFEATFTLQNDPNAAGYTWSIPLSASTIAGGNENNFITVIFNDIDDQEVCVTTNNDCGDSPIACESINILTVPTAPVIEGATTVCENEEANYCLQLIANATEYTWQVPTETTIISGQGTDCISVDWGNSLGGQVCAFATNDCGDSQSACFDVILEMAPTTEAIVGMDLVCVGDTSIYTTTALLDATAYYWDLPACANILSGDNTNEIIIEWTGPCANAMLCVTAANNCGEGLQECIEVTAVAMPTPFTTGDIEVCENTFLINVLSSTGSGVWSLLEGAGTAQFLSNTNPLTSVTVSESGDYTFLWTETAGNCEGTATLNATINQPISIVGDIIENCDLAAETYTVEFQITGGTPPYQVNGNVSGEVNVNYFVSEPVSGGSPYLFSITDTNCNPMNVEGINTCQCVTDAGTMMMDTLRACQNETVFALHNPDAFLELDDVLTFVLHDSPTTTLGEMFALNPVPEFGLATGMVIGQVYYISAVAGNELNGSVNLNDPCLSVSEGTPVIFKGLPTATLIANGTFCEQGVANVQIDLIGTPPFIVDLNGQEYDIATNSANLDYTITQATTLFLTQVTDAFGCTNELELTSDLDIVMPPVADVLPNGIVCNGGDDTTFDMSSLILSGDDTGDWTDFNGSGAIANGSVLDFNNLLPGNYIFIYTTNAAMAPCNNEAYQVEILVEPCDCPDIEIIEMAASCNEGIYDLSALQISNGAGNWTIIDNPGTATILPTITNTGFDIEGVSPGLYTLQFDLTIAPPPGCPSTAICAFTIDEAVSAGIPMEFARVCLDSDPIDINTLIQNQNPNGSWEEVSPLISNSFDPNTGILNPQNEIASAYLFEYSTVGNGSCEGDTVLVGVIVTPLPIADAGATQYLTCTEPTVLIDAANSTQGAGIIWIWEGELGEIIEPFNPIATTEGEYQLTVLDTISGCSAVDYVDIISNQSQPQVEFLISPISCYGLSDGAIEITSITGGQAPYTVSINESPFTADTLYNGLGQGNYNVIIQDANGCTTELNFDLEQPQEVDVDLIALLEEDNTILLGDSIDLLAMVSINISDIDEVIWTAPMDMPCDTCLTNSFTPIQTTTFSVIIESNGCTAEDNITIEVDPGNVYIPNAFSPNYDGRNDEFVIYSDQTVAQVQEFKIYDRWGDHVFENYNFQTNDYREGWNGSYKGEAMNTGIFTYYALIEFKDGRVEMFKGDVYLKF